MTNNPLRDLNASRYPALYGEPVTEAHVNACAEHGHATHKINGKDVGRCPRCGEPTNPHRGAVFIRADLFLKRREQ